MSPNLLILDRYILRQTLGTFGAVLGIVMSLMILEHLPRLLEVTELAGHRGFIITQSILGLLPEYLGIGLLVGLYLSIAVTVRRLALRGELDAIHASGVGPLRWMRTLGALAGVAAAITLANQGWIMPAGEKRLIDLGERMAAGHFGYNIAAGEFHRLGPATTIIYGGVDPGSGSQTRLFVHSRDQAYTAHKGQISLSPSGELLVKLVDGQSVSAADGRVLSFSLVEFGVPAERDLGRQSGRSADRFRIAPLDKLIRSPDARELSAAYARLLWPILCLLAPVIASVSGKPPVRSTGALGIPIGLFLIVLFIRMIQPLSDGNSASPVIIAIVIVTSWVYLVYLLVKLENRNGRGPIDQLVARAIERLKRR